MLKNNLSFIFEKAKVGKQTTELYERLFLRKGTNQHISVLISGTGQVGTSWCSLSIAHAMNLGKKQVLLVDGNGNFSNISSYFQLNNPKYIEDYINGNKTLNQLITAFKNKNFHILTGVSGQDYLSEQPLGRLQIFADDLCILAENYDHTIIDAGSQINEKNLSLCEIADNIIIMSSENNADLIKTFDLIKVLNERQIPTNYYLIINKVNSFEDGYKVYEKLHKASDRTGLNFPKLLGIVRLDTRVRDTIKNRELLLTRYPSSEAAIDIYNIAKKLGQEA